MKVCFPVQKANGIKSIVYGHFGSSKEFVIVDTVTKDVTAIKNSDKHHAHGMCNPLRALNGNKIDVVVVAGIGTGALMKLNNAGLKVYKALAKSIEKNIELLINNQLVEFSINHTCSNHKGICKH